MLFRVRMLPNDHDIMSSQGFASRRIVVLDVWGHGTASLKFVVR